MAFSVAKRLPCVIQIPEGKLEHPGDHCHSTDSTVFHFCETRLGHPPVKIPLDSNWLVAAKTADITVPSQEVCTCTIQVHHLAHLPQVIHRGSTKLIMDQCQE